MAATMLRENKKWFYIYILSSLSGTLYVGLTDHLLRRLREHKQGTYDSFTRKYEVSRLMYFETVRDSNVAEQREKQIKKYSRAKKIALFAKSNPEWKDLSAGLRGWGRGPSLRSGS